MDKEELSVAAQYFATTTLLTSIKPNEIVVPRFSMYPFYNDQEKEIRNLGAKSINSSQAYTYIQDLANWVVDLKEMTPRTWDRVIDIPENTPVIVKTAIKSRKDNWKDLMFAPTKAKAIEIQGKLLQDSLLGYQKIYYREYLPLVKFLDGIGDMPITKEFRFFVAYGKVISGGYYWDNYSEDIDVPDVSEVPQEFLNKAIARIGSNINFYSIDVAQTQSGGWIVIEINLGDQSGLSSNDPHVFYSNLKEAIIKASSP
jgi:hypothetical protein